MDNVQRAEPFFILCVRSNAEKVRMFVSVASSR